MTAVAPLRIGLLVDDPGLDADRIRHQQIPGHEVEHLPQSRSLPAAALIERLRSWDVVVTGRTAARMPGDLIADRGRLRALLHCHGSVRALVEKAHIQAGLAVCNWGDNVAGVAESALCLLLNGLKQIQALDRFIRADWRDDRRIYQDFPATLVGRDVGLYGFGPIGRHMARFLAVFGARVAIYDPYAQDIPADIRRCASLRELFASCQCVSIHCGLNDGTRHSVTRELLDLLPQGGVLINTARGAIVVEPDLAAAVASGRIVAGVDVIEQEKQWATSPLVAQPSDRVIVTGHIIGRGKGPAPGGPPRPYVLPDHVVANIQALAEGKPLTHAITAAVYDLKS
jgi:phosphoglycerate dehydrogenase-like enzyme